MTVDARPILITGITRSGTTWVASMLNATGRLVYVNEPLNPRHPPGGSPGLLRADISHRYQYICADNGDRFLSAFRDLCRLRYHLTAELRRNHRPSDLVRAGRHLAMFRRGAVMRRRLMVADPFAVFSSEWLARELGFQVVTLVRHPLAVVASRKRLGWSFDLGQLTGQPLLVRDWLADIERRWPEALAQPDDLVSGGAQLWRLVYEVVEQQRSRMPGMLLVRHEQLSIDPAGEFERLFHQLDLPFGDRARRAVREATSPGNPSRLAPGSPHAVRLDSRANLHSWRSSMSDQEVQRVLHIAGPLVDRLYPEGPVGTAPPPGLLGSR